MNFNEFSDRMNTVPFPAAPEYSPAFMWLNLERLPLALISLGKDPEGAIRIPDRAINPFGDHTVPVIAFGRDVFRGQKKITDIVLPSSVGRIPRGAFAGCSGLKRITIPKKVTSIREGTFAGCDSLEDVYYEGTPEEWKKVNVVSQKHEIEFGKAIPGTPVLETIAERLIHIPGNDALLTANLHFHCSFSKMGTGPDFRILANGADVTDFFRLP